MLTDLELAEYLNTKFCHDMAGLLGAISNGVEFLNHPSPMKEKAAELVETSARQAVVRLQFFRQAYGAAPDIGEANLAEIKTLLVNFFNETKASFIWDDHAVNQASVSISNRMAKLIMNLLVVLSHNLIHGGSIKFLPDQGVPCKSFSIILEGRDIRKNNEEMEKVLSGDSSVQVTSKNIQVYYAYRLASALKGKIVVDKSIDNQLVCRFVS